MRTKLYSWPQSISRDYSAGVWRAAWSGFAGSLVEWYDYYVYGTAAALVFSQQFFPDVDPATALIASFATFGVGFIARPIGGIVAGHYGDRIGRKIMLIVTLMLMGVATVGIGLLPGYAQIGIWAPILLVILRLVQGFAVGGEFGGATTLVVEYASAKRRGFFGSLPQTGNVAGLCVSTGVFSLVALLPDDQFQTWGWRIPFLLSIVLVFVGLYIRAKLDDTPAFKALQEKSENKKVVPIMALFRNYWKSVILAIGASATMFSASYLSITYVVAYATDSTALHASHILNGVTIAAVISMVLWPLWGWLSDKVGRRPVMLAGAALSLVMAFPFFWLVDTGSLVLTWIAIIVMCGVSVGLCTSVMPSLFCELFDTSVRYTGNSVAYQVPAVIVGGFTPTIAATLVAATGGAAWPVSIYIGAIALISIVCTIIMEETRGIDLQGKEAEGTKATYEVS